MVPLYFFSHAVVDITVFLNYILPKPKKHKVSAITDLTGSVLGKFMATKK